MGLELVSPGWKPGVLAAAPRSLTEPPAGIEPATNRLQDGCSAS